MKSKPVSFRCESMILEGEISIPEDQTGLAAVIVCHPNPVMGGDMYNLVVHHVCAEVEAKGMAALRFNFRGTGASTGWFDRGVGEQDDLRAALSFLEGIASIDKGRIGVAGYSFGAGVCTRVSVADERIKAFAAISLALRSAEIPELRSCTKPKLFLTGDSDDYCPADALQELVSALPDPKQLLVFEVTDHFWYYKVEDAARSVAEFFSKTL